jgi:hypothetical protein
LDGRVGKDFNRDYYSNGFLVSFDDKWLPELINARGHKINEHYALIVPIV